MAQTRRPVIKQTSTNNSAYRGLDQAEANRRYAQYRAQELAAQQAQAQDAASWQHFDHPACQRGVDQIPPSYR